MDSKKWWVKTINVDNGHGYELEGYELMFGDARIKFFSWTRGREIATTTANRLNNIFDEIDNKKQKTINLK